MSRKAKSTQAREELESRIGYTFADKTILERALTHISAASACWPGSPELDVSGMIAVSSFIARL